MEAWSKLYRDLFPNDPTPPNTSIFVGGCNDAVLQNIAPWLTPEERTWYSKRKEELYRQACKDDPVKNRLAPGVEDFLQELQKRQIPFGLASASIIENIDFFFEFFALGRWFKKEDVVYDDGTYQHKGQMHLEAARRMNISISDCLLVEDSLPAITEAKNLGAGTIVAIGTSAEPEVLLAAGGDHYIRDFTEFDYAWLK
jgi:HAD superfamily hydrolase (TIGR01509 family)